MSATTKNQQKGKELIQKFLNEWLDGSGLEWHFFEDTLDVIICSTSMKSIRVRCLLLDSQDGKYASPRYNLPANIAPEGASEWFIKQQAFNYFRGVYFLVVRKKGLSTTFWLDRFDEYPLAVYSLEARFKGKRKDRIVLNYAALNIKKFHYIEELVSRLKTIIHENPNS